MVGAETPVKPLNPVARAFLALAGSVFFALGIVGVYVPGLPTTPFLLLAAACWIRSSQRLYIRLVSNPRLGPQLKEIIEKKAIPRKVKFASLAIAWLVIVMLALFVVEQALWKVLLLGLGLAKTAVMLLLPSLHR